MVRSIKRGRRHEKPAVTRAQDEGQGDSGAMAVSARPYIDTLPDEILLKVFSHLSMVGGVDEEPAWYYSAFPFHRLEWQQAGSSAGGAQRGLRAYPFLAQVCRRWKGVLEAPHGKRLWREVTIDFGHEVVTSIHCPLMWSNRRPTEAQFRQSFASTTLSADKMLRFLEERRGHITSLSLLNSEGYWSDEGDFVSLAHKHDFACAHLGMAFGILRHTLQELKLRHCNDLLGAENSSMGVVGLLPNLRVLAVESLRCRVKGELLAGLSKLRKLEDLSIGAEEQVGVWMVGIDVIPSAWCHLTSLRRLSLRSNSLLESVPSFVCNFPQLTALDVSFCRNLNLNFIGVREAWPLQSLALQGMGLVEFPEEIPSALPHSRVLPPLHNLSSLTALSLADNRLARVPELLGKLTRLSCIDLSGNYLLQVPHPLASFPAALPHLRLVDVRGIHAETSISYWSESKCTTMQHLGALAKLLKRRPFQTYVLMDTD